MIRAVLPFGAAAVMLALSGLAHAQVPERWTDGMFEYETIAPSAGYFVPPTAFPGESPRIEQVLRRASRMSPAELASYATGASELKETKDFPMFAFEVAGPSVFLWKGERDGRQQQVLPHVWTGETWDRHGWNDGRADSIELMFGPTGGERKPYYVLIAQQNGEAGRDTLRTRFIHAGRFPGVAAILKAGLERADTVVYLPRTLAQIEDRTLDCLKGRVTAAELRELSLSGWDYETLHFLTRDRTTRRPWFAYRDGVFRNESGELHLGVSVGPTPFMHHARWALSAALSEAASRPTATLTWTDRGRDPDGWMRVELAVGRESPAPLYQVPITRSGNDGGQAVFTIRIRRGAVEATVSPRGRFGADSFRTIESVQLPELGCEYRFVDCGQGVIKLEVRAKARPWSAELQATYDEPHPWAAPAARVTTAVVLLSDG